MEAANKEQAMECLKLAEKARAAGDKEKARRMAEKSLKLCQTQKAEGERMFRVSTLLSVSVSAQLEQLYSVYRFPP